MDLAAVLAHVAEPRFLEAEHLFDHPQRMLSLGVDVGLGRLEQILRLPSGGVAGRARRLSDRIATQNFSALDVISDLLVMSYPVASTSTICS
jgi:hypothetical protein